MRDMNNGRSKSDWLTIALFCVTVIAGAVVGAALRSGMPDFQHTDSVYMADNTAR